MAGRRFRQKRKGSTTVEFAISAVILFSLVFFIIEFGQAVWRRNTIASLAKDAARYASVHGANSGSVADSAAVQAYVDSKDSGFTLVARTTWPDAGSKSPGKRVQVQLTGSYTSQTSLVPQGSFVLNSTAQALIAR